MPKPVQSNLRMLTNWNIAFWEYEFLSPNWLWLLLLVPIVVFLLFYFEKRKKGEWKYSGNVSTQKSFSSKRIVVMRQAIILTYGIIASLLILALAKPYNWNDHDDSNQDFKDGIDIILAIDVSGSMLAQDFSPNRIEAAKEVAKEFVDGRRGDRIGLVVFAGEAYTSCPATTDYSILKKQIDDVSCEVNIEGGTAIGVGLGTAVTRLRNDSLPSKVVILLTDGSNNAGTISPDEAADLARAKNVRVYTIGVGGTSEGPMAVQTPFGTLLQNGESEIDEATLQRIAQKTDGQYFRAKDEKGLREIYAEIEKLEKRKIVDRHYKSEPPAMPMAFLNWAFILALVTWFMQRYFFKIHE